MHVIVNVEFFATFLIGEAHLDDANTVDNGWVSEDRRRDIRGRADHQNGQAIVSREASGSLDKKANGRAHARRLRVFHRKTPPFDERRVRRHPETILDDIDENAQRGLARGCTDRWGVHRHYAQHFEPGLEQQIGDGPLVVDLVADIGREDYRSSGAGTLSATDPKIGNQKKRGKTDWAPGRSHSFSLSSPFDDA